MDKSIGVTCSYEAVVHGRLVCLRQKHALFLGLLFLVGRQWTLQLEQPLSIVAQHLSQTVHILQSLVQHE